MNLIKSILTCLFIFNVNAYSVAQNQLGKQDVVTQVAAIVNQHIITIADIERLILPKTFALRNDPTLTQQEFRSQYNALLQDGLDDMINRKLVLSEFERLREKSGGTIEFPEKLVDSRVKQIIDDEYNGSRIDFIRTISEQGVPIADFKRAIREDITVELMINQHVSNEITVSPQKISDFYHSNLKEYTSQDRVKVCLIVVSKQTTGAAQIITEVKNKLLDGASFTEMAQVYSEGTRKDSGGEYEWTTRNGEILRKDLEDFAFTLEKGEVSGIIEKNEGYYILYCKDKENGQLASITEVRASIEDVLLNEERTRLRKRWIDKLKSKAFIQKF